MSFKINGQDRSSSNNKQLRKNGQVPCSMYGKNIDSNNIQVTESDLKKCLKEGHTKIDLKVSGKNFLATIDEIQYDPGTSNILSVSFHAFNQNDKVTMSVPVNLIGKALGQTEGGNLTQQLQTVAIYGQAKDLPESIDVHVAKLELGSSLHISDLPTSSLYEIKDKTDKVIVACNYPKLRLMDDEPKATTEPTVETEFTAGSEQEIKSAA